MATDSASDAEWAAIPPEGQRLAGRCKSPFCGVPYFRPYRGTAVTHQRQCLSWQGRLLHAARLGRGQPCALAQGGRHHGGVRRSRVPRLSSDHHLPSFCESHRAVPLPVCLPAAPCPKMRATQPALLAMPGRSAGEPCRIRSAATQVAALIRMATDTHKLAPKGGRRRGGTPHASRAHWPPSGRECVLPTVPVPPRDVASWKIISPRQPPERSPRVHPSHWERSPAVAGTHSGTATRQARQIGDR